MLAKTWECYDRNVTWLREVSVALRCFVVVL